MTSSDAIELWSRIAEPDHEGFNAMDGASERRVFDVVRKDRPAAILIFVAHRSAVEPECDAELVFHAGRMHLQEKGRRLVRATVTLP